MTVLNIDPLLSTGVEKSKPVSTPPAAAHLYAVEAIAQSVKAVLQAPDGQKHDVLLKQSRLLGGYVAGSLINEEQAFSALKEAIDSRDCDNYLSAYKTIRAGLENGKLAPLDAESIKQARQEYAKNASSSATSEHVTILDRDVIRLNRDGERGLAELMGLLYAHRYLYDHTGKRWMRYSGGRWIPDETRQIRRDAIRGLQNQLLSTSNRLDKKISEKQLEPSPDENTETLEATRDSLRSTVRKLNKKALIDSVLDLAQSYLPVQANDFDRNALLLNLRNGTYDLKTSSFRPHSPTDLLSKQAQVQYVPDARCTEWETFLAMIFKKNDALISFVQRCVGYTLTGLSDLQAILFCYGSGGNGKSAFFSVMALLLGDYYHQIPIETLLTKQRDATAEYQLAGLKGARAVVGSEIPENRRLNESLVKDLTGSEGINARVPYGLPFTFRPSHTLWLFGNHRPVVRGSDAGIWRRLHLLPFSVQIPPEQRRPMHQVMAVFERELPGILNWALLGYQQYVQNGLQPPEIVQEATQTYREDSDLLALFLEEVCNVGSGLSCPAKTLYASYLDWCSKGAEQPTFRNSRQLNSALSDRGFTVEKGNANVTTVRGLALKVT